MTAPTGGGGLPEVLAVTGPTASGKTALAIELAERLSTEVISADSMQVYKGMAIGVAAPSAAQQARVCHHFIGFLSLDETFSAGRFQHEARAVVANLRKHGKPAVVAGGSGLYVRALIDGLFEGPPADEAVRKGLRERADSEGVPALYAELQRLDPDYAGDIHEGDLRRIVRALEVRELTGRPFSELHREHRGRTDSLKALQVALDWPRDQLYARIDRRADDMLGKGLMDEVRTLLEQGYGPRIERLRTLGYRELGAHLRGEIPLEDAMATLKQNTRRFAKRQLSWFRGDNRIVWYPASNAENPLSLVDAILERFRGYA